MIPDDIQGCSPTTQRVLPSSLVISPGHHRLFALRIDVCEQQEEYFEEGKVATEEVAPMIPDDIQGCSPTTQCVLPSSLVISPGHHHVLCCSPSNPNPRVNFVRLRTANRVDPNLILETRATIDRMQEQNLMYYNWKRFFPNYKELLRYALSFVKF
ncbi:hypothetical protein U9M48_003873 [Paspalum notatum var. saurae]|uniref:Uncharacterized protein n=1 Tax=Paspalum notatum var. saurae TaxID=547442 RepID=A0AAQ3SH83_PASNO